MSRIVTMGDTRKFGFESSIRLCAYTLLACCMLLGCGRYLPPVAPEVKSPRAVQELLVNTDTNGVTFAWRTPTQNRQGDELKLLDGYKIYRLEEHHPSDITRTDLSFDEIGTMEDTSITLREELREEAREGGEISRKIKVDEALTKFSFIDSKVEPGHIYLYKIVPVNQGDVEGLVAKIARVRFNGDASDVRLIDGSLLATDDF